MMRWLITSVSFIFPVIQKKNVLQDINVKIPVNKVLWLATRSPFGIRFKVTISQIHPTLPKALVYITPIKVLLIYMHVLSK